MARGIIRKPSFNKIVGAYRSQWKRFWMRAFTGGLYGSKGMGWLRNPKKALYNFWYKKTSISVYKLFGFKVSRGACFLAMLFASAKSILALPLDIKKAANARSKIKRHLKKSNGNSHPKSKRNNSAVGTAKKSASGQNEIMGTKLKKKRKSSGIMSSKIYEADNNPQTIVNLDKTIKLKKQEDIRYNFSPTILKDNIAPPKDEVSKISKEVEIDENTPKSKPKHNNDKYISKRMIISGSSYCNKAALSKLAVGTYFDLIREPDNPNDPNAIMLILGDEKIGYIPKNDTFSFVTCLKLNCKIYGVITDIDNISNPPKYEFETWFDKG